MREKIKNEIKKSLGNGRVKIILGAYSKKMADFFHFEINDVSNNVFRVEEGFPSSYLFDHLLHNIEISNRRVFIIDKITEYNDIDAIINLFAGRTDVDLIASSNVFLETSLGEKSTLVRGRTQYFYFPPFSCEDFSFNSISDVKDYIEHTDEDLFDGISNYKYVKEANVMYRYLIQEIGYPISFRRLYKSSRLNVSLNTFIEIFNYMAHRGFMHVIQRLDLDNNHVLPMIHYCYPSDPFFIYKNRDLNEGKWVKRAMESVVITKLLADSRYLYKAVSRNSDAALLNTFAFNSSGKRCLVKIHFDSNEDSLREYCSKKFLFPKYVIVLEDIDQSVDENGVTYIGLKHFLKRGI